MFKIIIVADDNIHLKKSIYDFKIAYFSEDDYVKKNQKAIISIHNYFSLCV